MDLKQLAQAEMDKTKDLILNYPWENPVAYGMWLAQTYYMVCHSTRLVAMAGAYVQIGNEKLHGRFVDHSKEERGHQLICINDIKNLGFQLKDFPQTYQSQSMYQVQYYWIQHRGAASFFGYTLALECLADQFGAEIWDRVAKAHGKKAAHFWETHSGADTEHTEEAFKHIKNLTPDELTAAKENLELSSEIYRGMLIESKARYQNLPLKKNAA